MDMTDRGDAAPLIKSPDAFPKRREHRKAHMKKLIEQNKLEHIDETDIGAILDHREGREAEQQSAGMNEAIRKKAGRGG